MAGAYFPLPLSRRPATDRLGANKPSPLSQNSPLNVSRDGSQAQQAYQELTLGGGAQGTHRNASILKNTNRVKFTVNELELKEPPSGHSGESRLDRRGYSLLPQRPLPIANILRVQDWGSVDPQRGRSAEQRSSTASPDVNGLAIDNKTTSTETGGYEISPSPYDKGRAITYAQERAPAACIPSLSKISEAKSPLQPCIVDCLHSHRGAISF